MRDAVSALARQDYAAARAAVDDARESFARDGVVGREAALGNLYASINVEQERAARDEARRSLTSVLPRPVPRLTSRGPPPGLRSSLVGTKPYYRVTCGFIKNCVQL